ncbi:MAG: sigma factor [Chloroflexota bacterium]
MNENQAIKRLKRGDINGLETLVRQHQVRAVRTAYLITQDRALAEDVVQAAFVRAYQHIDQFDVSRPTVTLDYAYADANRITVSFTARGKASASNAVLVFSNPTLTDANGQELYRLPLLSSGGGGGGSSDSDPIAEFSNSLTTNFDASSITDAPANINVRLSVEVAYTDAHTQGGMLSAGTATFDFSLPFNPGRSANVVQAVNAGGLDMTLRKVTVSPSLTRLDMCYTDPADDNNRAVPYGQVEVNGKIVVPEMELTLSGLAGQSIDADDNCRAIDIPAALQNEGGAWTITITRLRLQGSENLQEVAAAMKQQLNIIITPQPGNGFSYDTPPNADESLGDSVDSIVADAQDSIEGPWTFTFNLP